MFDPHAYTITVKRLRVDDEDLFRATIAEFPDLESYAPAFQEAYELAIDAIETLHLAYEEEGRGIPPPASEEQESTSHWRTATERRTTDEILVSLLPRAQG
jgi:predicted RNase H-like HicB family nuclease